MNQIQAVQYMAGLLPKNCVICERVLTLDDLKAGKIVGNLDPRFSILYCVDHIYSNGAFSPDYKVNVNKIAFATAVEIYRADGMLRGHDPEQDGNQVRCTKCGRHYFNLKDLIRIQCLS